MQTTFEVSQEWGDGLVGSIIVENNGSNILEPWEFTIKTTFDIDTSWGGKILKHAGNRYTIGPESWNWRLGPGESTKFGFVGSNSKDASHQVTIIPEPPAYLPTRLAAAHPEKAAIESIDFNVLNDWQGGFTADLSFTYDGTQPLDSWEFQFEAPFEIASLWHGDIVSQSVDQGVYRYTIRNAHWNGTLLPGDTITLGFNGKGPAGTGPTHYYFNDRPVDDALGNAGPSVSAATEQEKVGISSVNFDVENNWLRGFTANLSFTYDGTQPLASWELQFEAPFEIASLWHGDIVSQSVDQGVYRYTIRNAHWNGTLLPGDTITLGFNGKGRAENGPTNYYFNDEPVGNILGESVALNPPVNSPPANPPVANPPVANPPVELPTPAGPSGEDSPITESPTQKPPVKDTPLEESPTQDPTPEDPTTESPISGSPPSEPPPSEPPPSEQPSGEESPAKAPSSEETTTEPLISGPPPSEPPPSEPPPSEQPSGEESPAKAPSSEETTTEPPISGPPPSEPPSSEPSPSGPLPSEPPPSEPPISGPPPSEPPPSEPPPSEPLSGQDSPTEPSTGGPVTKPPISEPPAGESDSGQDSSGQDSLLGNPIAEQHSQSAEALAPENSSLYGEALQKSLLFYEAQRSGELPDDNRIAWRGNSALTDGADVTLGGATLDLTGGYYDAGDHVKFGFPMAASMTMLSWGVNEYRAAYVNSGQLDEALATVKWATDYFLKAHITVDSQGQVAQASDINDIEGEVLTGLTTQAFYGQVGDPDLDHQYWGPPESLDFARPAYKIDQDNPGADLAAETAAALASASIIFRATDPAYADELLANAKLLYAFAEDNPGLYSESIPKARGFYSSTGYADELVWGATWLYKATEAAGEDQSVLDQYLHKAEANYQHLGIDWTHNWDDKSYGTGVLLAQITDGQPGGQRYRTDVENWLNNWVSGGISRTADGLAWLNQWGSLRYSANTAFIAGVYSDTVNTTNAQQYNEFAKSQIDYILGDNLAQQSYVAGIGDNFPENIHHRAASGTADINDPSPNQHILHGALVGGPRDASNPFVYQDTRIDFVGNEVALDYNAGFVGAVAKFYGQEGGALLSDPELIALSEVGLSGIA